MIRKILFVGLLASCHHVRAATLDDNGLYHSFSVPNSVPEVSLSGAGAALAILAIVCLIARARKRPLVDRFAAAQTDMRARQTHIGGPGRLPVTYTDEELLTASIALRRRDAQVRAQRAMK